jgi:hypothetical protein
MHGMTDRLQKTETEVDGIEECMRWYYILRRTDVFAHGGTSEQANTKF